MHFPNNRSTLHAQVISLTWRRDGDRWQLFSDRRRVGHVVPDSQYPGMWRSVRADGQLSDITNLTRAKSAVLDAAERELAFEHRQRSANQSPKVQQSGTVFEAASSPVRQNRVEAAL